MLKHAIVRACLPYDPSTGSRLCAWDGETPVSNDRLFSEENTENYRRATVTLSHIFERERNKGILKYHGGRHKWFDFCVLETVVRLSSPATGYYYGGIADVEKAVPYGEETVKYSLLRLWRNGKIGMVCWHRDTPVYVVAEDQ